MSAAQIQKLRKYKEIYCERVLRKGASRKKLLFSGMKELCEFSQAHHGWSSMTPGNVYACRCFGMGSNPTQDFVRYVV